MSKKSRGKDRAEEGRKVKKNLEEVQARDIMRSSDLEELDRAEIPEELRHRLDSTDVAELDDLEEELGYKEEELPETQPEEVISEEYVAPQTEQPVYAAEEQAERIEKTVDASCVVKVSNDRMSAMVSLYPSQHGGNSLDFGTVKNELTSAGVVFGINEELLKKLIITVEKTHEEKEGVIIAKGLPPEEGKDGTIEYHFGEDEAALGEADQEQENT